MKEENVIEVKNLSKKFSRNIRKSLFLGSIDLLRNLIGIQADRSKLRKSEFWALKDLSFELKKGETLGIIGTNGSGKSTLLRLLSGIFPPDIGTIELKGKIGSLIAVGVGFHPHMTGRENIYLNGTILGMSRREIVEKFDSIVEFAEIEDFLDSPVSTYSSGMKVRLGFSIAIHVEPEILLIDEVLSVGDLAFRNKSMLKLHEYRKKANATIFVSHNLEQVLDISDRIIILDKGRIVFDGDPRQAIMLYHDIVHKDQLEKQIKSEHVYGENISSGDIHMINMSLVDQKGNKIDTVNEGENITVRYNFEVKKSIARPRIVSVIRDMKFGASAIRHVNVDRKEEIGDLQPGVYNLDVHFYKPALSAGLYNIAFKMQDARTLEYFEKILIDNKYLFRVESAGIPSGGIIDCKSKWVINKL